MNAYVKARIKALREAADHLMNLKMRGELTDLKSGVRRTRIELRALHNVADSLLGEAASIECVKPKRAHLGKTGLYMAELVGRRVRLLQTLRTWDGKEFRAGSTMVVQSHHRGGVTLETVSGVSRTILHVELYKLELK